MRGARSSTAASARRVPPAETFEQQALACRRDPELDQVSIAGIRFEPSAPGFPEPMQIEARVAREGFVREVRLLNASDAEHAHPARGIGDQIPDVDLRDQRIRSGAVGLGDAVGALVVEPADLIVPHSRSESIENGRSGRCAEPLRGVEQQAMACVLGAQLMHRRNRRGDLLEGRGKWFLQTEPADHRRSADKRHGLGFQWRERVQVSGVTRKQANTAGAPAVGIDGYAETRERIDVAQYRPLRNFQALGKDRDRGRAVVLQQQKQRNQTVGAHD